MHTDILIDYNIIFRIGDIPTLVIINTFNRY